MFKVSKLTKSIQQKKILNNIDFEIDHGQIALFLGESGAGKSTLLRVLNNLEPCDSGSFSLDNVPLDLTTVNRNHTIGMVFQHFNIFEHLTTEDNIILTLIKCKNTPPNEAREIAHSLLKRYGLLDKAKLPSSHLSGGQKQRLAIARTLSLDPKIICLDEPTSALDPRLTSQVAELITQLASENRIIILTSHDTHLLKLLKGNLFLMDNGSIIESTNSKTFASSPASFPHLQHFFMHE